MLVRIRETSRRRTQEMLGVKAAAAVAGVSGAIFTRG